MSTLLRGTVSSSSSRPTVPRRHAAKCAILLAALAATVHPAHAQSGAAEQSRDDGLGADIKAFVTAPLHADRMQWQRFGVAVAAVAAAHQYDDHVRSHFVGSPPPNPSHDTRDSRDAIPAALALGGTWGFAALLHDADGKHESRDMIESAAFGVASAYVLKEIAGRTRPYASGDSNDWRNGGDSFPSMHTTAAFAIGTVLAESGNDHYRFVRRAIGYGLVGVGTGYERLRHDAHWFSDTVAGAALGIAAARFVLKRGERSVDRPTLTVVPTVGGVALAYSRPLR